MGAWIEIHLRDQEPEQTCVAPFMGTWIKVIRRLTVRKFRELKLLGQIGNMPGESDTEVNGSKVTFVFEKIVGMEGAMLFQIQTKTKRTLCLLYASDTESLCITCKNIHFFHCLNIL